MSAGTAQALIFLTPTYQGDIERFALLRRSARLFAPKIPHHALVDDEDLPAFAKRFRGDEGLVLRPIDEVLPPRIASDRRLWRSGRGRLYERLGWRMRLGGRLLTGWCLQQIAKIAALAAMPPGTVGVFLDSDCFLCAPFSARDVIRPEGVRLRETPAATVQDFAYEFSLRSITGGDILAEARGFNAIHHAPAFLARTAAATITYLDGLGRPWWEQFLRVSHPSEYNLMAFVARGVERHAGYALDATTPDSWGYAAHRPEEVEGVLELCRQEDGARSFVLIQSNTGSATHLPACYKLLDALAARNGLASAA